MPTDTERREVARRLRELDYADLQVYDMTYFAIQSAVGGDGDQCPDGRELADRLADLIDPTCEVHRDALFYPATDLTPEHEETVFRCGKCDEVVSYDEDYDPETDLPAYCERCGSRITGIGEPWDE